MGKDFGENSSGTGGLCLRQVSGIVLDEPPVAFARILGDGGIVVAVNNDEQEACVEIRERSRERVIKI